MKKIHKLVRRNTIKAFEGCAGHHDSFYMDPRDGTILKKNSSKKDGVSEGDLMNRLMENPLANCIPRLYGVVNLDGIEFIKMEDLTRNCSNPAIMDIKLGSVTFLASEANISKLRSDLFDKMVKIDKNAPDEIERQRSSITKDRYLRFRDSRSTSANLAFRIEGLRLRSGEKIEKCLLNRIGNEDTVLRFLKVFLDESPISKLETRNLLYEKIQKIKIIAQSSIFLQDHVFIGTSLLFILDEDTVEVKLIDFAKVRPERILEENQNSKANSEWFRGVDNILRLLLRLQTE